MDVEAKNERENHVLPAKACKLNMAQCSIKNKSNISVLPNQAYSWYNTPGDLHVYPNEAYAMIGRQKQHFEIVVPNKSYGAHASECMNIPMFANGAYAACRFTDTTYEEPVYELVP